MAGRIAILALFLLAAAIPARAAIFGSDDRTPLLGADSTLYGGVGIVWAPVPGASGTGALVFRNDIVVTAAHLFFRDGQLIAPLDAYQFFIADSTGAGLVPYRILALYTVSGQPFGDDGADDIAVLRLDRPVAGAVRPLALPSDPAALASYRGAAALIAFHADRGGAQVPLIAPCAIRDRVALSFIARSHPLLYHDCDSAGQSSGGPIVVLENGRPVLGGVHSGHRSTGDFQPFDRASNYGLGVRVDSRLVDLILALP